MPTSRRTFVGQLLQYMRQVLKDGGEAVGSRLGREYSGKDAVMRGHDAELLPGSELDK